MNKKTILAILLTSVILIGCGGGSSSNGTQSTTEENVNNIAMDFFNISLVKSEWNNGEKLAGSVSSPLGGGTTRSYQGPSSENVLMKLEEAAYSGENDQASFARKADAYLLNVTSGTNANTSTLIETDSVIVVQYTYRDLALDLSNVSGEDVFDEFNYVQYIKIMLDNNKIYVISYLTYLDKAASNGIDIEKWKNTIQNASVR